MTGIKVYRAGTSEDEYGDTQPATWALWKTLDGQVAWGNPNEPLEAGRNTVITNRTVFIRGTAPSGIQASDEIEVDGIRYAIDGAVAEWGDPHVGTQFAVKAAT